MSMLSKKHEFDLVFDSQQVFRLILEAMSSPGTPVELGRYADKLYGDHPVCLAMTMTLLDNEVSFHVSGAPDLAEEIHALTLAKEMCIASADFVFVCNPDQLEQVIESAKCGSLTDPHKSATLIVENEGIPAYRLLLTGPGIDGQKEIWVTERIHNAIALRDAQNYEYPQGIDLFFLSKAGELVAIPRLTRMEVISWRT